MYFSCTVLLKSTLYRVSPPPQKKAEWQIFSTLRAKSVILLHHKIKHLLQKIIIPRLLIEFGWANLILCPFLEIQSFSYFACFLRPMNVELYQEMPFIHLFTALFLLLTRGINGLPPKPHMKGHSRHNSSLIGGKKQRNVKITMFQEMGIE